MGWIALTVALCAAVLAAVAPGDGLYVGMGLGIFAAACGWVGFRRRQDSGPRRLAGAGGLALGVLAVTLASARYGLALAALRRIERLLS
jgi:hypothetical protein